MNSIFSDDYIRALLSTAPQAAPAPAQPPGTVPGGDDSGAAPAARDMSAGSQKFFAAWKSWRTDGMLPRRAQVQLTAIARLMPQLVVLEVHGADRALFRLAGTDIEQAYGSRLTGRSFIKMADDADQRRRGELLWQLVSQPCAGIVQQIAEFSSGRREIFEIAGAPVLPDSADAPVQVFAVVSRLPGPPAPAPERNDVVIRNFGRNLRFIDIGAGVPAKG